MVSILDVSIEANETVLPNIPPSENLEINKSRFLVNMQKCCKEKFRVDDLFHDL